jgi:predicted hydrocarbon binding protein
MCRLLRGWYAQLIEMSGAKDVELTKTHCRNQGDDRCAWKAAWTV